MQEATANRAFSSNSQEEIFNQEMKEHVREYKIFSLAPSSFEKPFFWSMF